MVRFSAPFRSTKALFSVLGHRLIGFTQCSLWQEEGAKKKEGKGEEKKSSQMQGKNDFLSTYLLWYVSVFCGSS